MSALREAALRVIEHEPVAEVVSCLEEMLGLARRGKIRSIAVAVGLDGRWTGSAYHVAGESIADLVLSIERVKLRLLEDE